MSLAEAHESARERTIRANGLAHHVIEWGDAEASEVVLLCHGFLDLAWGFATIATKLVASGRRIIAFDFRGHGETEWVGAGGYYHFSDYVLDLHELVPQLTSQRLHLVGHSMGGTAATLYAATHPEHVKSLSLLEGLGPPGEHGSNAPERMKTWLAGVDAVRREREPTKLRDLAHAQDRLRARNPDLDPAVVEFLAQKATRAHPSGSGLAWRFDPLHRTLSPVGFDIARFMQFTAQIRVPTLLVYGERGLKAADDDARVATLADARRELIAGAGHMMHWTHAEATAARLNRHFEATR